MMYKQIDRDLSMSVSEHDTLMKFRESTMDILSKLSMTNRFGSKSPDFILAMRNTLEESLYKYAAESTTPWGNKFNINRIARYLGANRNTVRKVLNLLRDRHWTQGKLHGPRGSCKND